MVLCNAGVMAIPQRSASSYDGAEMQRFSRNWLEWFFVEQTWDRHTLFVVNLCKSRMPSFQSSTEQYSKKF